MKKELHVIRYEDTMGVTRCICVRGTIEEAMIDSSAKAPKKDEDVPYIVKKGTRHTTTRAERRAQKATHKRRDRSHKVAHERHMERLAYGRGMWCGTGADDIRFRKNAEAEEADRITAEEPDDVRTLWYSVHDTGYHAWTVSCTSCGIEVYAEWHGTLEEIKKECSRISDDTFHFSVVNENEHDYTVHEKNGILYRVGLYGNDENKEEEITDYEEICKILYPPEYSVEYWEDYDWDREEEYLYREKVVYHPTEYTDKGFEPRKIGDEISLIPSGWEVIRK